MHLCALFATTAVALWTLGGVPAAAQTWEVISQNGGYKVARVAMSGDATGIGITCERDAAVIAVNLSRSPQRNPAVLILRNGSASGAVPIVRNGGTNVWAGPVNDRAVLDGLASGQSVALSVDGHPYGTASLIGAGTAIRSALAGCWSPASSQVPGSSGAEVQAASGQLEAGIYVPADLSCTDLEWYSAFANYGGEAGPIAIGRDPDAEREYLSDLRITGKTTFTDDGVGYSLCPAGALATDVSLWPKSRMRNVSGLPIKPGLYRTFSHGSPIPSSERCGISAEYLLFEPTRVAMISEEAVLDRNGYPTARTTRRAVVKSLGRGWEQVGDRLYDHDYAPDDDGLLMGPWRVESPDTFEVYAGECDVIQFRPVDPDSVPPSLMPRF